MEEKTCSKRTSVHICRQISVLVYWNLRQVNSLFAGYSRGCGLNTRSNGTLWVSPAQSTATGGNSSSTTTSSTQGGTCILRIYKMAKDICHIRLDFIQFEVSKLAIVALSKLAIVALLCKYRGHRVRSIYKTYINGKQSSTNVKFPCFQISK